MTAARERWLPAPRSDMHRNAAWQYRSIMPKPAGVKEEVCDRNGRKLDLFYLSDY